MKSCHLQENGGTEIMLSEISQTQKDKYHIFSSVWKCENNDLREGIER
jgi:hypothetical protein